jgi:trimeric autotransporter adhesin
MDPPPTAAAPPAAPNVPALAGAAAVEAEGISLVLDGEAMLNGTSSSSSPVSDEAARSSFAPLSTDAGQRHTVVVTVGKRMKLTPVHHDGGATPHAAAAPARPSSDHRETVVGAFVVSNPLVLSSVVDEKDKLALEKKKKEEEEERRRRKRRFLLCFLLPCCCALVALVIGLAVGLTSGGAGTSSASPASTTTTTNNNNTSTTTAVSSTLGYRAGAAIPFPAVPASIFAGAGLTSASLSAPAAPVPGTIAAVLLREAVAQSVGANATADDVTVTSVSTVGVTPAELSVLLGLTNASVAAAFLSALPADRFNATAGAPLQNASFATGTWVLGASAPGNTVPSASSLASLASLDPLPPSPFNLTSAFLASSGIIPLTYVTVDVVLTSSPALNAALATQAQAQASNLTQPGGGANASALAAAFGALVAEGLGSFASSPSAQVLAGTVENVTAGTVPSAAVTGLVEAWVAAGGNVSAGEVTVSTYADGSVVVAPAGPPPSPSPSPSQTPTRTPTPTPSTTPSAPPAAGANASATSTPSQTPSTTPSAPAVGANVSATSTPSQTPTPSTTPSAPAAGASATSTPSPSPTVSDSPTPSPSPTVSDSPTSSPTPTVSESPTPSPTVSDSPTASPTPTVSDSPTPSTTPSLSSTPSNTPSETPTPSTTPSETPTPSITPSSSPTPSPSSSPRPTMYPLSLPSKKMVMFNSRVASMAVYRNALHIGGYFTGMGDGTPAKSIVMLDGSGVSTLPPNSFSNGVSATTNQQVAAMAEYMGKLYMGGVFQNLGDGTTSVNHVAAWDGSAWSRLPHRNSFGMGGGIAAMAVAHGRLYMGGGINYLADGTTPCRNIASWNGTHFSTLPVGNSGVALNVGVSTNVWALAEFQGMLYVGGAFTTLGDSATSAKYIAAWNGSTWTNLTAGNSNGVDSVVMALSVYNNKLYIGGGFTALGNGTSAIRVVAWDGSAWSVLPSGGSNGLTGAGAVVTAFGLFLNKLVVGGSFQTLGDGTSAKRLAAWDGSSWSTFAVGNTNGLGDTVSAICAYDGRLYVGGSFTSLGDGTTSYYMANASETTISPLFPDSRGAANAGLLGTSVNAIASVNGTAYFGGLLYALPDASQTLSNLAAWNGSAFRAVPGANFDRVVNAMTVFRNKLIVAGHFGSVGNRIASWDGIAWSVLGPSATNGVGNFPVFALAEYAGRLYVGGQFNTLMGSPAVTVNYIASWSGTAWSPLTSNGITGLGGFVRALAVYNNKLYIGGDFRWFGDYFTNAHRIAAWDGTAWSTLDTGTSRGIGVTVNPPVSVTALAVFNGLLYAGGSFTTLITGASANRLAAWNGSAWSTLPVGASNGVGGSVNALFNSSGKLFIGGAFTTLGDGSPAPYAATWDGNALTALQTSVTVTDQVKAFGALGDRILLGGTFTVFSDWSPANLVASV